MGHGHSNKGRCLANIKEQDMFGFVVSLNINK